MPALHALDCEPDGFRWVVMDDADQSVFAYLRLGGEAPPALVVCNFTPVPRYGYRLGVPQGGAWREVLNTDAACMAAATSAMAGVACGRQPSHDLPASLLLTLPPLATIVSCAGDRAARSRRMTERFAHRLPFGAELDGETTVSASGRPRPSADAGTRRGRSADGGGGRGLARCR